MLDKDFEHFMTTTMKAHCLQVWSLYDARNLLWRGATYWDAKELFEQGRTLFERKDIIIDPENYAYPPKSALVPSFKKWLALQKHDINAVNSLYLYEQAVRDRIWFVQEGIYDLEEMLETLPESLKPYVQAEMARLEEEELQLRLLHHELSEARDKARKSVKVQVAA